MSASVFASGSSFVPMTQVRNAQTTQPNSAAMLPRTRAVVKSMYPMLPIPAATLASRITPTACPMAPLSCSTSS